MGLSGLSAPLLGGIRMYLIQAHTSSLSAVRSILNLIGTSAESFCSVSPTPNDEVHARIISRNPAGRSLETHGRLFMRFHDCHECQLQGGIWEAEPNLEKVLSRHSWRSDASRPVRRLSVTKDFRPRLVCCAANCACSCQPRALRPVARWISTDTCTVEKTCIVGIVSILMLRAPIATGFVDGKTQGWLRRTAQCFANDTLLDPCGPCGSSFAIARRWSESPRCNGPCHLESNARHQTNL